MPVVTGSELYRIALMNENELGYAREALNKIDDYFEYRNATEEDRKVVYQILDEYAQKTLDMREQLK